MDGPSFNQDEVNSRQESRGGYPELIRDGGLELGSSVVGALVGLALGGATGAIAGATTTPVLTLTSRVVSRAVERRRARAQRVVLQAITDADLDPEGAVAALDADDERTDSFIGLLKMLMESDPALDRIFAALLSQTLTADGRQIDRLLIIGDAVRNLRHVHLCLLTSLSEFGGTLPAPAIASNLEIPEIELRGVVRDLELRGMIKDVGDHPTTWKLRELGTSVVRFASEATQ